MLSGAVGFPPQTADVYLAERIELTQRRSSVDNHLVGYSAKMIDPPLNWTRIEGVGRPVHPDSLILDLGVATYRLHVADSTRLLGTAGFGTGEYATSFGEVEARRLDECPE
jgi:hypothetical protein